MLYDFGRVQLFLCEKTPIRCEILDYWLDSNYALFLGILALEIMTLDSMSWHLKMVTCGLYQELYLGLKKSQSVGVFGKAHSPTWKLFPQMEMK